MTSFMMKFLMPILAITLSSCINKQTHSDPGVGNDVVDLDQPTANACVTTRAFVSAEVESRLRQEGWLPAYCSFTLRTYFRSGKRPALGDSPFDPEQLSLGNKNDFRDRIRDIRQRFTTEYSDTLAQTARTMFAISSERKRPGITGVIIGKELYHASVSLSPTNVCEFEFPSASPLTTCTLVTTDCFITLSSSDINFERLQQKLTSAKKAIGDAKCARQ